MDFDLDADTPVFAPEPLEPDPPPAPAPDPALETELAQLFEEQYAKLVAAAERVLRDPSEAEDAVQDALVSACRNLHRFRAEARLSTWLYRIVINAALMRVRKRKRRSEWSLDPEEALSVSVDAQQESRASRRQLAARVSACARRLPPRQRDLLADRYLQELPVERIAARRGISVGAAKTRLHRARAALRSLAEADCA
jgi:RNA polymerase sigma-70 factor (ECF subfamily)